MRNRHLMLATAMATLAITTGLAPTTVSPQVSLSANQVKGGRGRNRVVKPPMNGKRECARRRRQIAKGMPTVSNGLVYSA